MTSGFASLNRADGTYDAKLRNFSTSWSPLSSQGNFGRTVAGVGAPFRAICGLLFGQPIGKLTDLLPPRSGRSPAKHSCPPWEVREGSSNVRNGALRRSTALDPHSVFDRRMRLSQSRSYEREDQGSQQSYGFDRHLSLNGHVTPQPRFFGPQFLDGIA